MKKKILIVSHALELGGAERSLIGLLESIDTSQYCVDLFLLRHEGELLANIPQYVNLLPEVPEYTVLARPMKQVLKEGHILLTFARLIGKIKASYADKKNNYTESGVALEYSHKYTYKLMPKIEEGIKYDLAISFLTPHYIVANKVSAKKKIAWIHTDYSKVQIDVSSERTMWNMYDNIISISESVGDSFIKIFPELKEKVVLIENILPEKFIKFQTNEFSVLEEMPEGCIRLLSIGRYCFQKNFDSIPEICKKIVELGCNIKWYIIGFGPDEGLIRKRISDFGMLDRVILLGKKENPYPYIKACDIYVQPSRYEGKSVTVREAQMLGKPVIITNYKTSSSQLEDGVDGIIVSMDNDRCAEEVAKVIRNQNIQEKIVKNVGKKDYSNSNEVYKLYALID
ncbi:glycosyltransferase [Lachnospiraceae bacterium HCP28S3_F9]